MSAPLSRRLRAYVLPAYVALVIAFLVVPLLLVFPISISNTTFLVFPPRGFTWRWYVEFFSGSVWLSAMRTSLLLGLSTAAIATTIGTLAALATVRLSKTSAHILSAIFLAPQIVPAVIIALGGFLFLNSVGLYGTFVGILLMHVVLALPLVIITMTAGFRRAGHKLTLAARVLGASPLKAFLHVTLPLAMPSLITAAIFAFFISFDELVVTLFVSGSHVTLPMRIWADVRQELTPVVAAAASILTVLTLFVGVPVELYRRRALNLRKADAQPRQWRY